MLCCASLSAFAFPVHLETETARFRGGGIEASARASGGKLLGNGWGHRPDDFAELEFTLDEPRDAALFLRYAYDREQFLTRYPNTPVPHAVRVELDGRVVSDRLPMPDTADWQIYSHARLPLGRVEAGKHVLRLSPVGPANDLNLDSVTIAAPDHPLPTRAAEPTEARSGPFRIRLSPGVDRETISILKVAENVRIQFNYHRQWLGFTPQKEHVLTVVADKEWPNPSVSAWASNGNIYLNEKEAHTPGGNVAHEMFHAFEAGLDYPTWWSEGVAYVISMRSDKEIYGRGATMDASVARLKSWWEMEGRTLMVREGRNAVQLWGSDRVPADARRGLYNMANLMLYALWEREGEGFFRRFYTLVNADVKANRYRMRSLPIDQQNRLLLEYANRAAGKDLSEFWKQWGMPALDP
jgi:hypothetical protein